MQNYPNPFANSTTIKYFIPVDVSGAAIQVLDISGKKVFTNPVTGNGQGEIQINTNALSPGIYTYLLNTNKGVSDVRKMVILK